MATHKTGLDAVRAATPTSIAKIFPNAAPQPPRSNPRWPPRWPGLDSLRALAILLVFAYHYQVFVSRSDTFGLASRIGWTGVDLFFVLSGYLISRPLLLAIQQQQAISIRHFYARRWLRTLPMFYLVLAAYFLFPSTMGGKPPPPLWTFVLFVQNIGLHPGTAFSHAWSLCIEEQFYFVLPWVLLSLSALAARTGVHIAKLGLGLMLGMVALATLARAVLWQRYGLDTNDPAHSYSTWIYYSSLCRFDELLPGIFVAAIEVFRPQAWHGLMQAGKRLLVLALCAVVGVWLALDRWYYIDGYGYGQWMTILGYPLIAWTYALLVCAALSPNSFLGRTTLPGAAVLASSAYSTYLSHKALAVNLKELWQSPLAEAAQSLITELNTLAAWISVPLAISAAWAAWLGAALLTASITFTCFFVGFLMAYGLERPILRWRERCWPAAA